MCSYFQESWLTLPRSPRRPGFAFLICFSNHFEASPGPGWCLGASGEGRDLSVQLEGAASDILGSETSGSSRRTGSASSQRGHESRRRCSRIPRPPGLTVPDRSTMWSLSPAHAPPIPPPPPHIPTPGTETERNRMDQACVVGPLLLGMWSRRSGSAGWPQFQRETFGTPGKT